MKRTPFGRVLVASTATSLLVLLPILFVYEDAGSASALIGSAIVVTIAFPATLLLHEWLVRRLGEPDKTEKG